MKSLDSNKSFVWFLDKWHLCLKKKKKEKGEYVDTQTDKMDVADLVSKKMFHEIVYFTPLISFGIAWLWAMKACVKCFLWAESFVLRYTYLHEK